MQMDDMSTEEMGQQLRANLGVSPDVFRQLADPSNATEIQTRPVLRACKIHPDAQMPLRKRNEDAGYDIFAVQDGRILPGETAQIEAGIRLAIPEGYWILLRPRSSQGKIGLVSGTGVIDNGYTGPLGYYLTNTSRQVYEYKKGDRVGQMLPIRMHDFSREVQEITEDEIPTTERGSTGFGDSGGASWTGK